MGCLSLSKELFQVQGPFLCGWVEAEKLCTPDCLSQYFLYYFKFYFTFSCSLILLAILSFLSFVNSQKKNVLTFPLLLSPSVEDRLAIVFSLHNSVTSEYFDTKRFLYFDFWNNVYLVTVIAVIILKCNAKQAVLSFCCSIWKRKNLGWMTT